MISNNNSDLLHYLRPPADSGFDPQPHTSACSSTAWSSFKRWVVYRTVIMMSANTSPLTRSLERNRWPADNMNENNHLEKSSRVHLLAEQARLLTDYFLNDFELHRM